MQECCLRNTHHLSWLIPTRSCEHAQRNGDWTGAAFSDGTRQVPFRILPHALILPNAIETEVIVCHLCGKIAPRASSSLFGRDVLVILTRGSNKATLRPVLNQHSTGSPSTSSTSRAQIPKDPLHKPCPKCNYELCCLQIRYYRHLNVPVDI